MEPPMPCMECFDSSPGTFCSSCGYTVPPDSPSNNPPSGLKTICHCAGCVFHPKHKDFIDLSIPFGWTPGEPLHSEASSPVNCLKPSQESIEMLSEESQASLSFPVTAYGAGAVATTGHSDPVKGIQLLACCLNEKNDGE